MDIYIVHPDATVVELSTDNGGSGDNYINTVFDDEAATLITAGSAPFTGSFRPEGSLAALDGKAANGTWRLRVTDDEALIAGTLSAWSATVCGNVAAVSADYSDLASTYGAAWHTGNGALRLGPTWTADAGFGPDTDTDDGVAFISNFAAGQPATLRVNVQGTPASGRWLRVWFDWNSSGVFDTTEKVVDGAAIAGNNDLSVNVPGNLTGAVKYRVRLYDSAGAPAEAIDAASHGGASGGEVEDGASPSPLSVTLANFSAAQQGDLVRVAWETVSELDNAGFNLYRTGSVGDRPEQGDLIAVLPSQAPGSTQGAAYSYEDLAVQPGETWWYWLEDVSMSGAATLHGPVSVHFTAPTAVTLGSLSASPAAAGALLPWLLAAAGAGAALAVRRRR